ncbi:sigma-70 family RNA polymerase sigma factor [Intestinimonas butyriciproducens]|uniref:sigma-70 family RNA polymerase sigma factor n=1 Tax=Intestinimonas butyriciproducens TaxID=1297617 RepID=UPI0018ABB5FE|nr:sigma-70 family RNA polymerase sigma factor [Intestinimonas butyriciproducens]MDB7816541.1 sigma-70 family RNA polymerase sigma factor [Intestinimonas butyriciproducens]MDB7842689.1 sigma-70 family RNA polymerase sigma factor [Intestinimonas butyriciproducens]MDB7857563.1 sigma-70 family RNA polymerase sigma factor [Intestinimonas butyriciproducens]
MTTINLKEFFYWYIADEFIEVTEEVAEELRKDKRYEYTHWRRMKRNKSNYSLDADDGIENDACFFECSPEVLILQEEQIEYLCRALNSLNDLQGRRVDANIILGRKIIEVAASEGVSAKAVSESVKLGLWNMKKYLKKFYF